MYKSVSRFMKRTGIKVGRLGAPKFGSKTRKKAKSKRRQKGKKIKSFIGGPIRRLRRALQIKVVCPQGCGFSAPKRELLEHIRAIHGIHAGLHPWRDKNRTLTPTEVRVDIFYPGNAEAQANQAAQILKDLGASVQSTMVMSSPTAIQQFGHLYYFPGAGGNLSQAGKIIDALAPLMKLKATSQSHEPPKGFQYAIWIGCADNNMHESRQSCESL